MADGTQMYHPVTGATAEVSEDNADWYADNGWLDATPYEFQDNSWLAVHPDANDAQEQAQVDAQGIQEQPAEQKPKQSKTTAADPDAAGVKADAGPS